MTKKKHLQMGRLALRHEGHFWNAYFAKQETMVGAVLLGSIRLSVVRDNAEVYRRFIELMKATVDHPIKELFETETEWGDERPGPEHEKAGHG